MNIAKITIVLVILFSLGSCVQKTHQKTILFKLDMRAIENPTNVGVRGEFGTDPWNETLFLTDEDGNGIFEGSITKQTGQSGMEFKFVNNNDQFELSGQANRLISFEYLPESIVYQAKFNDPNAKVTIETSDKE